MCCLFPIPEPYSCFIPALALSPSKGWTTLLSIPVSFLFLPHHLQKPLDNPSFHSCSFSVAFQSPDNPSSHPSPIPFLPLPPSYFFSPFFPFHSHSRPFPVAFTRLAIPSFPSSPILAPFLLLPCRLQKAGQSFFPFLSHSCSCSVAFKKAGQTVISILTLSLLLLCHLPKGWTTLLSIPVPFLFFPLSPNYLLHTPVPSS